MDNQFSNILNELGFDSKARKNIPVEYCLAESLATLVNEKSQPNLSKEVREYLVLYHAFLVGNLRYTQQIIYTHNDYPAAYDEDYIENVLSMIADVAYVLGY